MKPTDDTERSGIRAESREDERDYEDSSRLSSWLTAPVAAALLGAVFLASALAPSPEPPHGTLVGPWSVETAPVVVAPPTPVAADLATADPASQGLDPERLARGIERLGRQAGLRTVLVVRNGRIVAERSFAGDGLNRRSHDIKSASKSLLSALVGIAIERGEIAGLEATVAELLPEYAGDLPVAKRAITLGDLLTMQSGLGSTSGEHYGAWVSQADWTAAALARPVEGEPGTAFTYSTGNSHLISAILTEAAGGRDTLALVRERLLGPLGVEVAGWEQAPEGYYLGGNGFRITPVGLARFGQLYLDAGVQGDSRMVPREWIERSTSRHAEGWPERYGAYGYLWWLPPDDPRDSFAAIGYGGQLLYVVPELDMLAVITATHEPKGAEWDRQTFEILREDVFGAAS